MSELFAGRWALVTGASSGLGESFARKLAARGAHVALCARSRGKLEELAGELRAAHGVKTEVLAFDLAAANGPAALCDELERRGVALRHLVSNAGFGTNGPISQSEPARQAEMVRLNCEALVYVTTRLLPTLLRSPDGSGVLHVGSIAGLQPVPYMATYGATKALVESFSLALAEETRGTGLRVMVLCPGPVPTGFQKVAGSDIAPSQGAAVLSADETTEKALVAYERRETRLIPGTVNRIQALGSQLVPNSIRVPIVARMMKKKRRVE